MLKVVRRSPFCCGTSIIMTCKKLQVSQCTKPSSWVLMFLFDMFHLHVGKMIYSYMAFRCCMSYVISQLGINLAKHIRSNYQPTQVCEIVSDYCYSYPEHPVASLYGLLTYSYHKIQPKVGNYTIHG